MKANPLWDDRVMAETQLLRFGDFEFLQRRQELRKGGLRVRISASQIRLLLLFLEHPGELVTREDIASRLWSDAGMVDVASGVNTAINRLRFCLGDHSVSPRYLETVIGLGYRFIAPVDRVPDGSLAAPEAEEVLASPAFPQAVVASQLEIGAPSPGHKRGLPLWTLWSAFGVLLVVSAFAAVHFGARSAVQVARSALKVTAASRVTANTGGKQITATALSLDGKLLAYADASGIRIQNLATQQEYSLGTLPASEFNQLSWFPNGEKLAVSGRDVNTKRNTVWLIALSGVGTSVLAVGANLAAVSPDGEVAFTRAEDTELWVADREGLSLRKLWQVQGKDVLSFVLWSPDNKRLMLVSHSAHPVIPGPGVEDSRKPLIRMNESPANSQQPDHWAWDSVDSATGKLLAHEENFPMASAVISPAGFVQFVTGSSQGNVLTRGKVFSVHTDPATGRFLEPPVRESSLAAHMVEAITASQDGSKLALIATTRTADVFTALLRNDAGGKPTFAELHRLTSNLADTYPHAWSPDGTVIYETTYQDHLAIFGKQQEASPVLLAQLPIDAAMAQLTPDARWILFLGIEAGQINVYRVPSSGGVPERVPGATGENVEISCARKGPMACVLRRKQNDRGVAERQYFALDPMTGIGKLLARTPWVPSRRGDWSVSPDGSTVAVANRDTVHPALSVLKLGEASTYEKVIQLSGHDAPLGAAWSSDGKAVFIETRTADGFALLYMRIGGQPHVLRESHSLIWAVPSPDGKQIAFPEGTLNANLWVSDSKPDSVRGTNGNYTARP